MAADSIANVLPPNRIVGQNTYLEVQDSDGHLYQLVPKDDNGQGLIFKKDGAEISPPFRRVVSAKTADYTVKESECGTLFTTTGASAAVNFTLPTADADNVGLWYEFFNAADQNMTITSGTADKMVVFNDVAADSIAFSTASEKIGGGVRVVSDGSKWLVFVALGAETQTPTIAT